MKLTVFDFIIKHRLEKNSFINVLSRKTDYQNLNEKL